MSPTETMPAATSPTTTVVYFQISRRCGRAGGSTCVLRVVMRLPIDLVGPDDHLLRHLDPEPGRRLEVEGELDRRDHVDGQVCGRLAAEQVVDVARAGSPERREIDPVGEEGPLLDPFLAVPWTGSRARLASLIVSAE